MPRKEVPWIVGTTELEASASLSSLVSPPPHISLLWFVSASLRCLLLAKDITIDIRVYRMARHLEGNVREYSIGKGVGS
jgi:hypothetical protein